MVLMPSSAAQAFRKALEWKSVMESEGISQSEIARRAGLTRARVTQILSLLKLPQEIQERLLNNSPEVRDLSIRRAMKGVIPQDPIRC